MHNTKREATGQVELSQRVWQFIELVARGNTEFHVLEGMAEDLLELKCNRPDAAEVTR